MSSQSDVITAATVEDVQERLERAIGAMGEGKYMDASELAYEAGEELEALNRRLVREARESR